MDIDLPSPPTVIAALEMNRSQDPGTGRAHDLPEVVVIGRRGAARGGLAPETEFTERQLRALGGTDLGKIVEIVTGIAGRGQGAGPPIVLLNGRRIADMSAMASIPPEAIERTEVLPPQTALAYGFSSAQVVINFVTRDPFSQTSGDLRAGTAARGDRTTLGGGLSATAIRPGQILTTAIKVQDAGAVEDSHGATLAPSDTSGSASLSLAQDVGGRRLTLGLGADRTETMGRWGAAATGRVLQTQTRSTVRLSGLIDGYVGDWTYAASAKVNLANTASAMVSEGGGAVGAGGRTTRAETRQTDLELILSGPALSLPAGQAIAGVTLTGSDAWSRSGGSEIGGELNREIDRRTLHGGFTLTAPLVASDEDGRWRRLRGLALNLTGGADAGANASTLGGGVSWEPAEGVNLSLNYEIARERPSLEVLNRPAATVVTPMIDPRSGELAVVEVLGGGNPDLRSSERQALNAGVMYQAGTFSVSTFYSDSVTSDPTVSLAMGTPTSELYFPERFRRDGAGRLTGLDARPFTLAETRQTGLRSSLNYAWSGLDLPGTRLDGASLNLAANHSWRLRDEIRLPSGVVLNQLRGQSLGVTEETARHEAQLALFGSVGEIGGSLSASWTARRKVGAEAGAALFYPASALVDLAAFARLSAKMWGPLQGTDVTFGIGNLLDVRKRLRRAGDTTFGKSGPAIDPLGRSFRIGIRKRF